MNDLRFVEIRDNDLWLVEMQYPLLGRKNAYERCLVREAVEERLRQAAKALPAGFRLKIWDAWRPFALQEELYHAYSDEIIKSFHLESLTEAERKERIRVYISLPVNDPEHPPVHTTGGAVDVTVVDADGCELAMGTAFDAFLPSTQTDYFEMKEKDETIAVNRRLLYDAMTGAGFTNLESEWWHYDYGDAMWSERTGKPVMYYGVFTVSEAENKVNVLK